MLVSHSCSTKVNHYSKNTAKGKSTFYVTIGSFDSVKIFKLLDLFILNELLKNVDEKGIAGKPALLKNVQAD